MAGIDAEAGIRTLSKHMFALARLVGLCLVAAFCAWDVGASTLFRLSEADEERILGLDPGNVSEREVREVLSKAPGPRIFSFEGTLGYSMDSFGEFLAAMGYPSQMLLNPKNGSYTYPTYMKSQQVAGAVAWYYERDGMAPMLIGHSGGGVTVNRVLYDLAGIDGERIQVWNPIERVSEPRYTVLDPYTRVDRDVVGLRVSYAAMLATGKLMRLFLMQWKDVDRIRKIPDATEEFTGFLIPGDPIAGESMEPEKYQPLEKDRGPMQLRNVVLPESTSHIRAFQLQGLATNEATRAWIDAYAPDRPLSPIPDAVSGIETSNILHAADIWYSVKKHWCIEAQRVIRGRRALEDSGTR